MKCQTCNICLDKKNCAKANGFEKAPDPILEFRIKLCMQPKELHKLREEKK